MSENTSSSIPTAKQQKELEKQQAIAELRKLLPPGTCVGTILRHVSKSGMARDISLVITQHANIINITHLAALAMGEKVRESGGHNAIRISGCGMDMGFELVYRLGWILCPKGFIPRDAGYYSGRNGTSAESLDTDGGYSLKQFWI
jgi:hypothetical protein